MIRKNNLPGKYSDEEMAQLENRAAQAGLNLASYIRKQLKLPAINMGAPKGNQNARHAPRKAKSNQS